MIRLWLLLLAALLAIPVSAGAKTARRASYRGVPIAALVAAAKTAPLKSIDALETYCDGETPIGDWLKALTASEARSVVWSAGKCELVNNLNPLDAGGDYCVQATITLKRPKNRADRPEIEIYLEDPKQGRIGETYAFRAFFDTTDGPDYIRFRKDFDDDWRARFPDTPAPVCED